MNCPKCGKGIHMSSGNTDYGDYPIKLYCNSGRDICDWEDNFEDAKYEALQEAIDNLIERWDLELKCAVKIIDMGEAGRLIIKHHNAFNENERLDQDNLQLKAEICRLRSESMNELQSELGKWQDEIFPAKTNVSIIAHLAREVVELGNQAAKFDTHSSGIEYAALRMELADVLILSIGLAHNMHTSALRCIREKFEINKTRKWGKPDAQGVVEHVKEGER